VLALERFHPSRFLPRQRAMSFLIYFVVLIIAAGAALFGLDVITAPLPEHKPAAPVMSAASTPNKLAKRQAEQAERDVAANRVLTPIYPANPGGLREVTTDKPPSAETTGSTPAVDAPAPTQKSDVAAAPAKPVATVAQPAPAKPPAVQDVSQQASGHCDIQACANAYHSFRATDCTYQPYEGPRRACVAPAMQAHNETPLQRAARQPVRSSMTPAAVPRYRQLPPDDEDMTDDDMTDQVAPDDVDVPPNDDQGSIVVYQRSRWFR
jgi:hypothetical protein